MRPSPHAAVTTSLARAVAPAALALALPALAAAEVTRTVKAELTPEGRFAVENLAGTMTVGPGSGSSVVVVATVHAEDQALADAVSVEPVRGKGGVATLRVRYPLDKVSTIRYGRSKSGDGGGFFAHMFDGTSNTDYDGERVRVSSHDGKLLYADLEVQLPKGSLEGAFINHIGRVSAREVTGTLRFSSGSGDIDLQKLGGRIAAESGSGDVKASGISGELACETGSGSCGASDVTGEKVACSTGSGDIELDHVKAARVKVETGSGTIGAAALDAEELVAETGSGDIEVEARQGRLTRVSAETGSGDVRLKMGAGAAFEATAEQGSGDITSGYSDAQAIVHGREVVGYRRGTGGTKIAVETGSGDFTIEP